MAMTSKQRLMTALQRGAADRLPVTTHHLMPYFLDKYMGGMSNQEFFEHFGLDPITWTVPHRPDPAAGEYFDPAQGAIGFLESRRIASDNWRVECEDVPGQAYADDRYRFVTPKGALSMVLQSNEHTAWVVEPLIKEKRDIDLIGEFVTAPKCDVEAVNRVGRGLRRAGAGARPHLLLRRLRPARHLAGRHLPGRHERLIMETYDDPGWVHELLAILQRRKKAFVRSLRARATTSWNWAAATPPRR